MNELKYRALILHSMADINRALSGVGAPVRVELREGFTEDQMREAFNDALADRLLNALSVCDGLRPLDRLKIRTSTHYNGLMRVWKSLDSMLGTYERTNQVDSERVQTGIDRI